MSCYSKEDDSKYPVIIAKAASRNYTFEVIKLGVYRYHDISGQVVSNSPIDYEIKVTISSNGCAQEFMCKIMLEDNGLERYIIEFEGVDEVVGERRAHCV